MGRLQGKIAMVTGAGTGIGRACMVMFAREGATVYGVARTQANLDETLALVKSAGGQGSVHLTCKRPCSALECRIQQHRQHPPPHSCDEAPAQARGEKCEPSGFERVAPGPYFVDGGAGMKPGAGVLGGSAAAFGSTTIAASEESLSSR